MESRAETRHLACSPRLALLRVINDDHTSLARAATLFTRSPARLSLARSSPAPIDLFRPLAGRP